MNLDNSIFSVTYLILNLFVGDFKAAFPCLSKLDKRPQEQAWRLAWHA